MLEIKNGNADAIVEISLTLQELLLEEGIKQVVVVIGKQDSAI